MSPCSVETCSAVATRKGLCGRHYLRQRRHGSPLAGSGDRNIVIPWLKHHVSFDRDECLRWPFAYRSNGYGSVTLEGRHTTASRAMCLLAHGEPKVSSMDAAHSCGNGHLGCVNPKHLRWATHLENMADAVAAGTLCSGEARAAVNKENARKRRLSAAMRPTHSHRRILA